MSLTKVYSKNLPRHSHNISESRFFDMDMGVLTPIYAREMYPGDKVKITETAVLESRTLSAPLKNNVTYREYWFFVPRRLCWKNWEKFIFGGKTGDYTTTPPFLQVGSSGSSSAVKVSQMSAKSLYDYFGFPIPPDFYTNSITTTLGDIYTFLDNVRIDAMPFAAYQMIYKDWFRNENFSADGWDFENAGQAWLSDGANFTLKDSDGNVLDDVTYGTLCSKRYVPWSRNYFTAALPFRQRGTANRVPLHGTAFLKVFNNSTGAYIDDAKSAFIEGSQRDGAGDSQTSTVFQGYVPTYALGPQSSSRTGGTMPIQRTSYPNGENLVLSIPPTGFTNQFGVSGTDLQGFTISELRLLAKLQEFQEINARFGFRYIEGLRGHFGVSPTDSRLDRPEFIGGMRQEIVFNEILQTSETSTTPLGTPAGRGISAGGNRIGSYYAEEHGILIGLATIMPQQIFTQGIPRMWTRHTKEEFFSPEFNGLSEQEITEKEVYATPGMTSSQLDGVFGYVPSWEELRHGKSMAVGNLRNPNQTDLYAWTMARNFTSAPTLGENFLFASQDNSNGGIRTDAWTTGNSASPFFVSLHHKIRLTSTVSKSGTPGITRI